MSVTFCPRCGGSNDESNRFCVKCGSPIAIEPATVPEQPLIPPVGKLPNTSAPTTSALMRVVHCTKCKTPNDASRSTCSRCGAVLPSSDPSFWTNRNRMLAGLLGVILIFGSAMLANDNNGSQSSTSPASTSGDATDATDAPARATPKPDLHTLRANAAHYWNFSLLQLAVANSAISFAKDDLADSDLVSASRDVTEGSKYAGLAVGYAQNNIPDGWNGVGQPLSNSANLFQSALDDMHTYFDTKKPSDGEKALNENDAANAALYKAEAIARERFKSMGGDPSTLLTPDQAVKGMAAVISAMKQQ